MAKDDPKFTILVDEVLGVFWRLFVAVGSNYKTAIGLVGNLKKCSTKKRSRMKI